MTFVCVEKDIVCGPHSANWCAACPLRHHTGTFAEHHRERAAAARQAEIEAARPRLEPAQFNLSQERAKARQSGYIEGISASTSRNLVALLKRCVAMAGEWERKYGEHDPDWLPPAGHIRLMEDIAEALEGRNTPTTWARG